MATQTLAVKYRPTTFDDVVGQSSIKSILTNQLTTKTTKNAYLFCGGAGTGKTTCARIFANAINNGQGNPIEMDAASNSGVNDVREIIAQAKTKSLDSEYKVFIIDECHAISNTGWQAFLKLIEEPPAKSIFIFATTDPQKIPKTILSRVQRYDFQRISQEGIVNRLSLIFQSEFGRTLCDREAIEYIAKIADGGMRDAITLMDKCLAYSADLTISNVLTALGETDYDTFIKLLTAIVTKDAETVISIIESVHMSGKDLKQFMKLFMSFVLDVVKLSLYKDFQFVTIPSIYEDDLKIALANADTCRAVLDDVVKLHASLKWETAPKALIEADLLLLTL